MLPITVKQSWVSLIRYDGKGPNFVAESHGKKQGTLFNL